MSDTNDRSRATNIRIDGMTPDEQEAFTDKIKKAKREVAPDARLTIVEGSQKQLSSNNVKQQQIKGDD